MDGMPVCRLHPFLVFWVLACLFYCWVPLMFHRHCQRQLHRQHVNLLFPSFLSWSLANLKLHVRGESCLGISYFPHLSRFVREDSPLK